MARAIINNAVSKHLSEVRLRSVTFDLKHLAARAQFEYLYDDGTSHTEIVLVTQTTDPNTHPPTPTLDGIRDFFLVFRTATSINDLETKTLNFYKSKLGDVTVEP